jgi:hypothetical protein
LARETRARFAKLAPLSGRRDHGQTVRVVTVDQRSWVTSPLFIARSDVVPSSTGERIREIAFECSANDALVPAQQARGIFIARFDATEQKRRSCSAIALLRFLARNGA